MRKEDYTYPHIDKHEHIDPTLKQTNTKPQTHIHKLTRNRNENKGKPPPATPGLQPRDSTKRLLLHSPLTPGYVSPRSIAGAYLPEDIKGGGRETAGGKCL